MNPYLAPIRLLVLALGSLAQVLLAPQQYWVAQLLFRILYEIQGSTQLAQGKLPPHGYCR